jgi:hypothetical protein
MAIRRLVTVIGLLRVTSLPVHWFPAAFAGRDRLPSRNPRHLRSRPCATADLRNEGCAVDQHRASRNEAAHVRPSQGLLEGRRLSSGLVRGLTALVEFQTCNDSHPGRPSAPTVRITHARQLCSAREYFNIVSSGKLGLHPFNVASGLPAESEPQLLHNPLLVKEALDLARQLAQTLKSLRFPRRRCPRA